MQTIKTLILISSLSCTLFACTKKNGSAQVTTSEHVPTMEAPVANAISEAETKEIITYLASDQLNGRDSGSEGFDQAADYVENYFKDHNIIPLFDSYKEPYEAKGKSLYNVVGITKKWNPEAETVILSGHLDHLPKADKGEDEIYNGANDNASGSTAAMQIAAYLAKNEDISQNVIVVLFSGEEMGLLGSQFMAQDLKNKGIEPDLMFNFEMVGAELTNAPNTVYMTGFDKSNLAQVLNEEAGRELVVFFKQAKKLNLFYRSDNASFFEAFHIPAHTFSSFDFKNYDYYHQVDDEVEFLDVDNMNEIINSMALAIEDLLLAKTEIKLNDNE